MLVLDRLLEHVDLTMQPFALCRLQEGDRFVMTDRREVLVHFVLCGRGVLRYRDIALPIAPANLVVVPGGANHSIEPDGSVGHELDAAQARCLILPSGIAELVGGGREDLLVACGRVRVTYGASIGLFDRLREPLLVDFSGDDRVTRLFDGLLSEHRSGEPASARMSELLMQQLLLLVFRRLCVRGECSLPWLAALEDPGLARALDAILRDAAANHTVESLADLAAMSRTVFAERFTGAFGKPPGDVVRAARLQLGARLLRTTDLSVKEVATRVGFASRSHFSRTFKRLFGREPARFRADA